MTGTRPSKITAKREAKISEILDCAEKNFTEKGFHGAGISGIADDCGISVGHLYHYFGRKDDLIRAVILRELDRQEARLVDLDLAASDHVREDLTQKAADIITRNEDPFRTVLNFEILAEAQRNPDVAQMLQMHDLHIRTVFANVLQRAGITQSMRRTELLFTLFSGLPARALRHPEQEREMLLDMIKEVIFKILDDKMEEDSIEVSAQCNKVCS